MKLDLEEKLGVGLKLKKKTFLLKSFQIKILLKAH